MRNGGGELHGVYYNRIIFSKHHMLWIFIWFISSKMGHKWVYNFLLELSRVEECSEGVLHDANVSFNTPIMYGSFETSVEHFTMLMMLSKRFRFQRARLFRNLRIFLPDMPYCSPTKKKMAKRYLAFRLFYRDQTCE